jgi:hypothetical protein
VLWPSSAAARSLERIARYPRLILVTIHRIRMVFKTDTIPILVRNLAGIIQTGILVYHHRCRLQDIDKEHAKEKPHQKWHELQMIEEFHFPYRKQGK